MDNVELVKDLSAEIAKRLQRSRTPIPIGVSNRHIHVTKEHFATLFGPGRDITKFRDLKQPGFYAAEEKIDIVGPKGSIKGVRLLGPFRPHTQMEVSLTDAIGLGAKPPVRESGDVKGSGALRLVGPQGTVELPEGLIISRRHLHMAPSEAQAMGMQDREIVRLRVGRGTDRDTVFGSVVVRVSDQFSLELHLDTDEANAAGVKNGDSAYIV